MSAVGPADPTPAPQRWFARRRRRWYKVAVTRPRRDHAAFTLVELLVTAALILIMYALLYGPWTENYQEKQIRACAKQLQHLHVALQIYAADHRGWYPAVPGAASADIPLSLLVPRSTAQTELFLCPGTKDPPLPSAQPFAGHRISYAYYMGYQGQGSPTDVLLTDEQVDIQPKVARQLLFSPDGKPPGRNHRRFGGNLLCRDGSVLASPPHAPRDLNPPAGVVLLNPRPR